MKTYKDILKKLKRLLNENNAKIIAHYYVDEIIQRLAEDTGGFVSDSLQMAKFGSKQTQSTLIVAGVRFMGETAKILNSEKRILMIDMDATCSLDTSCPSDNFRNFCERYPDHERVVYANTSAQVKAISDWVVTSSMAVSLIEYLTSMGKKIIWAPDKYLGQYIIDQTGADMILWDGSCVVHEEYKTKSLIKLKNKYPDCDILVHPESPRSIIQLADVVGSTTKLIEFSKKSRKKYIIVATEKGILYQMKKFSPEKIFFEAPTEGDGATCKSCGRCPWMNMNTLNKLLNVFNNPTNEIKLDEQIIENAKLPIERMVNFKDNYTINKAS
ncbi:MAG: quinolinate synthase NadA [Pseudomonadota bacterium]|nr:quinolinate synthase NadA [Pseudomonadota bacterium]